MSGVPLLVRPCWLGVPWWLGCRYIRGLGYLGDFRGYLDGWAIWGLGIYQWLGTLLLGDLGVGCTSLLGDLVVGLGTLWLGPI
jgi:hypothetical protein